MVGQGAEVAVKNSGHHVRSAMPRHWHYQSFLDTDVR